MNSASGSPTKDDAPGADGEGRITLGLLIAIADNERVTQRDVAGELGIALGLANAYLKRCVTKGLVKVASAPANRYLYYLTPKGFAEKSRLTGEFLTQSFHFFRIARSECAGLLTRAQAHGAVRIGLAGLSDLAEIAALTALENNIRLSAILEPQPQRAEAHGLPVIAEETADGDFDLIIVTDMTHPQATFDRLAGRFGVECVTAPGILRIGRALAPSVGEAP